MKTKEWFKIVKENKDDLYSLIRRYHPNNLKPHLDEEEVAPFITAPNAERACEVVREQIRKESFDCPEAQFNIALNKKDCETLHSLLSAAWFGVPETTACWQIRGFGVAVNLLDNPPNE
jgi:hypothetical protein